MRAHARAYFFELGHFELLFSPITQSFGEAGAHVVASGKGGSRVGPRADKSVDSVVHTVVVCIFLNLFARRLILVVRAKDSLDRRGRPVWLAESRRN